jgi:hypothetical protein
MKTLLVTYDLNGPGQDYENLYEILKSAPKWAHYLDSSWFIKTKEGVTEWQKKLTKAMDNNDRLFVVDISNSNYSGWLPRTTWDWISKDE